MDNNQNFYYIIPAQLAEGNKPKKALLYGLIVSLANKQGYCWATNDYLGQKLDIKGESTISHYVSELVKEGWLHREVNAGKGNKRKLSLPEQEGLTLRTRGVDSKNNTSCSQQQEGGNSKDQKNNEKSEKKRASNVNKSNVNKSINNNEFSGENEQDPPSEKKKEIFSYWNEKENTIEHRKFKKKMKRSINARFKEGYAFEEIKKAIENYNKILGDDSFWLDYRWRLDEFLQRALDKCLSWEICESNYKDQKNKKSVSKF